MRWYQKLFWRIFAAVWLVSTLGILVSIGIYQGISSDHERSGFQQERARLYAEQLIDDLESGREPKVRQGRRLPLWIIDEDSDRVVFGEGRKPPRGAEKLEIESSSGRDYEVYFPGVSEVLLMQKMFGFLLSVQAIWLGLVSLFSSLLLTWLIVRPINALRTHVRSVYDSQNLSTRADQSLSQRTDELGELAREIDHMADFIERTLNAQENLLRDVSHELRAPLARLQVSAGLAEQRLGEDDKLVQRINLECARLEHLISELLLLSRQQVAGATQPKIMLSQMLIELIDDARLLDPRREIELKLRPTDSKQTIAIEPLSRVVSNLLNNAIKHTEPEAKISLDVTVADQFMDLEVCDSGAGVAPELLANLGDAFRRGSTSKGYGLGLSICKRAVLQMGGKISFTNRPEGGFCAKITIPLPSR